MPRIAWFSPMPPVRSGVASVSADLVPALRGSFDIDVFVDGATIGPHPRPAAARGPGLGLPAAALAKAGTRGSGLGTRGSGLGLPAAALAKAGTRGSGRPVEDPRPVGDPRPRSAHDFIWLNQQAPYDLTVYQLGNSSVHNYMWPYLFRYPGLTVLHDVHLHHARAASLLQAWRASDYRVEFAANHPDANADLAEVAVKGFDNHLYYQWPMIRLVAERSRMTAVHAEQLACQLRREAPAATVEAIRLGHGRPLECEDTARQSLRGRYGIPEHAVVFGCFGGLTPEKRLPQIVAAFAATRALEPEARLLLAGAVPLHYDLHADIERAGLAASATVTGYLRGDEELDAHIGACDVALNLRWPTAREISGPWLRSLAAGVPTVITQLTHLADVPALDPRTWRPNTSINGSTDGAGQTPVCVAIDLLDEDHSLRLAMRRLARDAALRRTLGTAGRAWWQARHTPAAMLEDYLRIIRRALERPVPEIALPPHLLDEGFGTLDRVVDAIGVPNPLR